MRMLKLVIVSAVLFVLAMVISSQTYLGLWLHKHLRGERSNYTATVASADLGLGTRTTTIYAARRDGSRATIITRTYSDKNGEHEVNVAKIVDIPRRRIITVDHGTRSTATTPIPKGSVSAYVLPPDKSCRDYYEWAGAKTVAGTAGTVSGQPAIRVTQVLPRSPATRDQWFVPSLDCLLAKEVVTDPTSTDNKTIGYSDLVSLKHGDPDPELFTVPRDYTERPLGDILAEAYRLSGAAMSDCEKRTVSALNRSYVEQRTGKSGPR